MSDTVIVAIVGGIAGIVTTLITGIPKLFEMWKAHKGDTIEVRIKNAMDETFKKCSEMTNKKLDNIQRDVTRMRLLSLMRHEPEDAENILIVAKMYFKDMEGNSEASKCFAKWLKKENIKRPSWFLWEDSNGKK